MAPENGRMSAKEILEMYFLDNRARLLEIASFLDRIGRYSGASEAKNDFRYRSFMKALKVVMGTEKERTKNIQLLFSDLSEEPIDTVVDPRAYGAWKEISREGD